MSLRFELPRRTVFGRGAINQLPAALDTLPQVARVTLVHGASASAALAEERVRPPLEAAGLATEAVALPPGSDTDAMAALARVATSGDVLVAVGGGRVMDHTKLLAAWRGAPWIAVPTQATNDAIASPYLGFATKRVARESGRLDDCSVPMAIVADTAIIAEAPASGLAAGVGDALSKVTAVLDWRLGAAATDEPWFDYAAGLAEMSADLLIGEQAALSAGGEAAALALIQSLVGSGIAMAIAGSSRPASGSEHLISHALDADALEQGRPVGSHGVQCGLATLLMATHHGLDVAPLRATLRAAGAPVTAEAAGIPADRLVAAIVRAPTLRDRWTILHARPLDGRGAAALLEQAEVA